MQSTSKLLSALLSLAVAVQTYALVEQTPKLDLSSSRRQVMSAFGVVAGSLFADSAFAFDNRISTKYDDRPNRRGPKPTDLGVGPRKDIVGDEYIGLKHCNANGAPNCFCSTENPEDDPEHSIPAWVWPSEFGNDKAKAFQQLVEAVNSYEPGQGNVDGGGFKVITSSPEKGYIYVQFESLKNGYIDDMELAFIEGFGDRSVQVRSSSRVGYLDFGVNAKRLNFIAKILREKGWDAKGVDFEKYQNYVIQNELS